MSSYVVTGASRGIGLEYVKQLSEPSDNKVFAIVRNKSTAIQLEELKAKRPNLYVLQADVKDHKALSAAAEEVSRITGGTLDVLINNAALIRSDRHLLLLDGYPDADTLTEDILDSVHSNVIGVIHTVNAFLPLIRAGRTKKVISISSGAADAAGVLITGDPGVGPYSISKAGLNMAVAKYAVEYRAEGVVFLALSPGVVGTDSVTRLVDEHPQAFDDMMSKLKNFKPDFEGPLTTERSVKMQLKVINEVTIKDTGAFLSHHGNTTEWL